MEDLNDPFALLGYWDKSTQIIMVAKELKESNILIHKKAGPIILKPSLWTRLPPQKSLKLTKRLDMKKGGEADLLAQGRYISLNESATSGLTWCIADSALFNSRRFRAAWTLNACTPYAFSRLVPGTGAHHVANAVQLVGLYAPISTDESRLNTIRANCVDYLSVQLDLTEFVSKEESKLARRLPLLKPKRGNELVRRCFECAQQIRSSIGNVALE